MTDLQALIDATPDGGTLTVPAGNYPNAETVVIEDRHGLTVDATGAVLCRKDATPGLNRQLLIMGSTDITIRYLTVNGPKPDSAGYTPDYESQHAIAIAGGSQGITIERCVFHRVWGDFLYVAGASDVTLDWNVGYQCGRHGLSVTNASRLVVAVNQFDMCHRWSVDLEPTTSTDRIDHCLIAYNGFYRPTIGFVCGQDHAGVDVSTLTIGGNHESWDAPPEAAA